MPLANLETLTNQILADIQADQVSLKTVEMYGGQLDFTDTQRVNFKAPAVFVYSDGGTPSEQKKKKVIDINWRFVAYIVCGSDKGSTHSKEASDIAQSLMKLIKNNQWGLAPDVKRAVINRVQNAGSLNKLTIWSIDWSQALKLACQ